MERSKQIAAIAESDEEKMCLIRVCDRMERAREREMPASSAFLSPREHRAKQTMITTNVEMIVIKGSEDVS